jgi:hypothetical protein
MIVLSHEYGLSRAGLRIFAVFLIALLSALAVDAQAQVSIGTVKTAGGSATNSVDILTVALSGSNPALVVAVCFNNNDFQLPSTVVLDPGGASQTSLTWLDNAAGITPASGTCAQRVDLYRRDRFSP